MEPPRVYSVFFLVITSIYLLGWDVTISMGNGVEYFKTITPIYVSSVIIGGLISLIMTIKKAVRV